MTVFLLIISLVLGLLSLGLVSIREIERLKEKLAIAFRYIDRDRRRITALEEQIYGENTSIRTELIEP